MNKPRQILRWIALFLCVTRSGLADTIYSTYGPDPYTQNAFPIHSFGWYYNAIGVGRSIAAPFSVGVAYRLESITVDIGRNIENSPNMQIAIYGDNNGVPALTPITFIHPDPTMTESERQSIAYAFTEQIMLEPGTRYWVALEPKVYAVTYQIYNADYGVSSSSVTPGFAARGYTFARGDWSDWTFAQNTPPPVFRLDGTLVPEPSTWALLGLGSALFWCAARRRRK